MGTAVLFTRNRRTVGEILDEFLLWKEAGGKAGSTVKSYRDFLRVLVNRHNLDMISPQKATLEYLSTAKNPYTYNLRLTYARSFFLWAISRGYCAENPTDGFKRRQTDPRIVRHDISVLRALIGAPDRTTYAGARDYALIVLTIDTGIRPGEAFSLRRDDVDLRSLEIYVPAHSAKSRKGRTLPMSSVTGEAIVALLNVKPKEWEASRVFCTSDGATMTRRAWEDRLKIYSRSLGREIKPYDLRHSFALHFLKSGGDALTLQRIMGHSDLSMTRRYVAFSDDDVRTVHNESSPLWSILGKPKKRLRAL